MSAVQAITRNTRITPQKVREVARVIQGLPAEKAVETLRYIPRKAARLLRKTLQSAIANAENNHSLNAAELVVTSARANQGPVLKRIRPSAKGSAHPIRKSTSHIHVELDVAAPAETVVKPRRAKKAAAKNEEA
jgi:large subunit ribosomal protein L22